MTRQNRAHPLPSQPPRGHRGSMRAILVLGLVAWMAGCVGHIVVEEAESGSATPTDAAPPPDAAPDAPAEASVPTCLLAPPPTGDKVDRCGMTWEDGGEVCRCTYLMQGPPGTQWTGCDVECCGVFKCLPGLDSCGMDPSVCGCHESCGSTTSE
jgi:hypothetical protein